MSAFVTALSSVIIVIAGASSPSTVTFTSTAPTSLVANANSTWTVGFTSSSSGALGSGSSITITMPVGFTTSSTSPVITLSTPSSFSSSCNATGVDTNQLNVITVDLTTKSGACALGSNTAATLKVAVVNGWAGTFGPGNFTVATSADVTAVAPTTGATLTATSVSAVSVTGTAPTSRVISAASTWTWGFTTSAESSLTAGSTITLTFPSGFTTLTNQPVVVLKSPSNFSTLCLASASDPTLTNTIVVTLANNAANTCVIGSSVAASLSIAVVNGSTDVLSTFSLATSEDVTAVSPTGTAPSLTAATKTTSVSFTTTAPTSLVASHAATWTVNLATSTAGALAAGDYVVVSMPAGFTTATTTPAVSLLTPATFPTSCLATASDLTQSNTVIITLANNGATTCALATSTAASIAIGVVNGPAGTYGFSTYSLLTSRDGTTSSPTSGSETIVAAGPPGTGTNWNVASATSPGEATAALAPGAPTSLQGSQSGGFMCASTATEVVTLSWTPVAHATSYQLQQSTTSSGSYAAVSPTPTYVGATATVTYTTAVTEYYKVEAFVGTSWVSPLSSGAFNGGVSPGYVVLATSSPKCTNN